MYSFRTFICLLDEILFSPLLIAIYGRFPIYSSLRDEAGSIDNCRMHFIGRVSLGDFISEVIFFFGIEFGRSAYRWWRNPITERHNNCTRGKQFGFGRSTKFSLQLLLHFRCPSSGNPSGLPRIPPRGNDFPLTEILFSHYEESH